MGNLVGTGSPNLSHRALIGLAITAGILGWIATLATPYMVAASIAYFTMLWGFIFRKNRKLHALLMNAAMVMDFAIVLILELQRDAVAEALRFSMTFFQQAHIGTSVVAVLLYFPTLYLGWGRYRGKLQNPAAREWHINLGIAALLFRTAGFFLMFSMIEHVVR